MGWLTKRIDWGAQHTTSGSANAGLVRTSQDGMEIGVSLMITRI